MPLIVLVWCGGLVVALPVLCAFGRASRQFDEEADDGLRRLMLRELARRHTDRRDDDRRRVSVAVAEDRRQENRRVAERREDRIDGTHAIELNDHPQVIHLPQWPEPGTPVTPGVQHPALAR
jgi:hypothetical protein